MNVERASSAESEPRIEQTYRVRQSLVPETDFKKLSSREPSSPSVEDRASCATVSRGRITLALEALLLLTVVTITGCWEAQQPEHVRVMHLRGDPYERGYQHGVACASEIRSFYTQMLDTSLLPYLNREQPDIAEFLTRYRGEEYADGRFSYQLMLDSGDVMAEEMPPEYLEEIQGIADGAGLPYEQILVHNTYVDTLLSLRIITYFIRGLQGPALMSVVIDGELDSDGVDNDGDGEVDEENEGALDPWDPSPHATFVEVPVGASVRMVLEDMDALAELAGEESTGGEGVNPDSIRLMVDTEVLESDDPQISTRTITSDEGKEQLEVTFTPAGDFQPSSIVSLLLQAGDLSWVTDPPPAHARNMRYERLVFTTEGYGATPEEVENRGERDGISQPSSLGMAMTGSATADGLPRLGYHFALVDANTAHKHNVIAVHHPNDGTPFVVLGWAGIVWGFTGMNSAGLSYAATASDTLDIGMVIDVITNMNRLDQAELFVPGVPMGIMGREILARGSTVGEAADAFEAMPRTVGWNFMLADGEGGILSLEMDSDILNTGDGFHRIAPGDAGAAGRSSVGPDDLRMGAHAVSNVNDFDFSPMRPQRFWSSYYFRSLRAFYILGDHIDDRYGEIDSEAVVEIMRDPDLIDQRDSLLAVIYEPAVPAFHVAAGQVPATDGEFDYYDLDELFAGGEQ